MPQGPSAGSPAGADATVIDLVETEAFATEWALPNDATSQTVTVAAGAANSPGSSLDA